MKKIITAVFLLVSVFGFTTFAKAQSTSTPNDFILEPGKTEIFANSGESVEKSITVTNRNSSRVSFKVEVEDFVGTNEQNRPVVLLGNEKSPYSFKDNIIPQITSFSLEPNANITIPIKINVPANAQPGGFYTAVLVSNIPSTGNASSSGVRLVSRVGTLFFVRVNGVAKESGSLDDLQIIRPTSDNPNLYKFNILFRNDGNVHLVPYGWVMVTDAFGKIVGKIPVDAYFALPKSIRYREVNWNAPFLFGRYEASVQLNRGYGSNLIDTKTIAFWVIPWKISAIALAVSLIIFFAFYLFFKKFKLVAKQ